MSPRRRDNAGKTALSFALYSLFTLFAFTLDCTEAEKKKARKYEALDSKGIYDLSFELALKYPEFVTLTTAQNRFGLDTAGTDADCPFEKDIIGCSNWILTIQDNVLYPPGSKESLALPEVLMSGTLHGNERVGPTVVMEYAALLLNSADCESYPRINPPKAAAPEIVKEEYQEQLKRSKQCKSYLTKHGTMDSERRWLARLVSTRRIVIVPTANSLGYFRNEMEENGVDPDSDFPFDLAEGNDLCMQTNAAKTMNELVRSSMFQIMVSYHAGILAVGHPWSGPSFRNAMAPDAKAQMQIAEKMVDYSGKSYGGASAVTGQIISLNYASRGSMEDWAYAGAWGQDDRFCKTNGTGYEDVEGLEKSKPTDQGNRALSFYIGTSIQKSPPNDKLGTSIGLLKDVQKKASGHMARNIRIALLATDIAEPYVVIGSVDSQKLQDDIVPLRANENRLCIDTKKFQVPTGKSLKIEWEVGGAFAVEDTMLIYGKWSDFPEDVDGFSQPLSLVDIITNKNNLRDESNLYVEYVGSGHAKWGRSATKFTFDLPTDKFETGDSVAVFAVAVVDKSWASKVDGTIKPKLAQQSHLVNRRINPSWSKTLGHKSLVGHNHWFSIPITLNINGKGVKVKETSSRVPQLKVFDKMRERVYEKADLIENEIEQDVFTPTFASFMIATLFLIMVYVLYQNRKKKTDKSYETLDDGVHDEYADLQLT